MLANIEANGILGFRGNSHGNTFLKNYLRKLGVTNDRISFYYGLKETKIILGPITNKYVINKLNIEHTTDWTISCLSISINNKSYPTTHDILFDTGSSVVLFPADIYTLFRQHIV